MQALPMVLRSYEALVADGKAQPLVTPLPVAALGTTFTMAQEAVWLDNTHYAVGRWDGSLSIFTFTASPTEGPVMARVVNSPALEGVQMITPLIGDRAFFSSNDEGSIALWYSASGNWQDLALSETLPYNSDFGVANSGAVLLADDQLYFVVGHANGRLTIWTPQSNWMPVGVVDVRAAHPVNPWGLTNVRGIAVLPGAGPYGYVVCGSEDGNLTVVRIPDGAIMSATVYNPAAQRGINSIAVNGTTLLLANCAVGPNDFNLWCYAIDTASWQIQTTDRARLAVDPSAPQVFNFDVIWAAPASGPPYFACSTEEGALWMGTVSAAGKLQPIGNQVVSSGLGAALCCQNGQLALTARDLYEFAVQPQGGLVRAAGAVASR